MTANRPTDEWEPTDADMVWCRGLIASLADGGYWGSRIGLYRFSQANRTLTLVVRSPLFDPEMHARDVRAFGAIGIVVQDATEEEPDKAKKRKRANG